MNGLKKCVMSSIKDFRIVKLVFFVFTVILLFDELRKEFKKNFFKNQNDVYFLDSS